MFKFLALVLNYFDFATFPSRNLSCFSNTSLWKLLPSSLSFCPRNIMYPQAANVDKMAMMFSLMRNFSRAFWYWAGGTESGTSLVLLYVPPKTMMRLSRALSFLMPPMFPPEYGRRWRGTSFKKCCNIVWNGNQKRFKHETHGQKRNQNRSSAGMTLSVW